MIANNFFTFFDSAVGNTEFGGQIDFATPYARIRGSGDRSYDVYSFVITNDMLNPTSIPVDVSGGSALTHYIHRFSAANAHATAVFGLTPAFFRDEHRGFSTFEFQLAVDGTPRSGDLVLVKSAPLHVGNTSMRLFHQMLDARTGTRLATLDQLGVLLDLDARRPSPLPDWMKERARAALAPTT